MYIKKHRGRHDELFVLVSRVNPRTLTFKLLLSPSTYLQRQFLKLCAKSNINGP